MSRKTTIPLMLDNVDSDISIERTPFKIRLFQFGKEIKKKRWKIGVASYEVETTDDGDNKILVSGNLLTGRDFVFRNKTYAIDREMDSVGILLSVIPSIILLSVIIASLDIMIESPAGFLLSGIGIVCALVSVMAMRNVKSRVKQIGYCVLLTILYIVLTLLIGLFLLLFVFEIKW